MVQYFMVLAVLLLCVAAISVRVLFVKGASMRGTCASQTPQLNKEGIACGLCGKLPGEGCAEDEEK